MFFRIEELGGADFYNKKEPKMPISFSMYLLSRLLCLMAFSKKTLIYSLGYLV